MNENREMITPETDSYMVGQRDYPTRCADVESALTAARERVEEWDHQNDAHGWWHERPDWIALHNEVIRLRALLAPRPTSRREPQVVEREAAIVETLRGGPLTAPGLASVLYARQRPSRGHIAMVTQSLIVLERDGIARRQPLMTGRRHWELTP